MPQVQHHRHPRQHSQVLCSLRFQHLRIHSEVLICQPVSAHSAQQLHHGLQGDPNSILVRVVGCCEIAAGQKSRSGVEAAQVFIGALPDTMGVIGDYQIFDAGGTLVQCS